MKKIKPDKRCPVLCGKLITEKKKGFKASDRPAAAFYCVQKGIEIWADRQRKQIY